MSNPKPEELVQIQYQPPTTDGRTRRSSSVRHLLLQRASQEPQIPGPANPRQWQPFDAIGNCRRTGRNIILNGMEERLRKFRSFRLFMDICVRCGACADKCHFYIGSGDPKNMPVLRAELIRSVYRRYFTPAAGLFGSLAGPATSPRT